MGATNHRPVTVLLSMVVLVAGCSSSVASLAPASSATPTPAATPTPRPSASPMPTRTAGSVTVDTVAVTVVDGLRVRSKPRVSDDSLKFEPLLPLGTQLYVLDGPVSVSGYPWYEVVPLASRTLPRGWVATTSRSGEPWLAAGDFACPPLPSDLPSLAALPSGVGLACFPRVPITVTARLIGCNCDMDGSWYTPSWFFLGSGGPTLLVEPRVTHPPENPGDWFALSLDPTGQSPDVLPVGEVVEVTGIFDHPAATTCTRTEMDGEPVPSQGCRLEFAVTRLVVVGR
jgi:hypothetical protein